MTAYSKREEDYRHRRAGSLASEASDKMADLVFVAFADGAAHARKQVAGLIRDNVYRRRADGSTYLDEAALRAIVEGLEL